MGFMSHRPVQLILDFDGTLTKKDTLHLVAEAGYSRQKTKTGSQRPPPWQEMVNAYLADYEDHASEYRPTKTERTTIVREAAWLDSLQDVEEASANRVVDAGIFDDLSMQDMEKAATNALSNSQLELRPGWDQLMARMYHVNQGVDSTRLPSEMLHLVSVNWSRWFVWSVIWKAASLLSEHTLTEQVKQTLSNAAVYANEVPSIILESESSSASRFHPGGCAMTLRTAGDKLRHMQSKAAGSESGLCPVKVYVGDSATDLECLLMADVGICVRDREMSSGQKELEATCERVGVHLRSIDQFQPRSRTVSTLEQLQEMSGKEPLILYYAHDFNEIEQWLATWTGSNP